MRGGYSKIPGGNITCSTFVKLDGSNEGQVLAAGAGDITWGIASEAPRRIALDGYDTALAAASGDPAVRIYGDGDMDVLLRISATVNSGDRLKSDGSGYGTPTSSDKDTYGAIALEGGTNGKLVRVLVKTGDISK